MLVSRSSVTLHRLFSHHFRSLSAYSTQRKEQDDVSQSNKFDEEHKRQESLVSRIKSNKLFDEERKRQESLIARIEKIQVTVEDVKPETEHVILLMNKGISTPFDCAQHISELYTTRSVLATVTFGNCDYLWDMHRPLPDDCTLRFHHFTQPDPRILNLVFWRSCSFLLGMVLRTALKEESETFLHSWPPPDLRSGSFVYDVSMPSIKEWNPTQNDMLALTSVLWKIKEKKIAFERLSVSRDLAKQILSPNHLKAKQIDGMPETTKTVTLYRLGDHIDISTGPMISNLGHIGRASVTAVHRIDSDDGPLFRFQGVAIPDQLKMNHFAYKILLERSKKLNTTRFGR